MEDYPRLRVRYTDARVGANATRPARVDGRDSGDLSESAARLPRIPLNWPAHLQPPEQQPRADTLPDHRRRLLKTAVSWDVIERMLCTIRLLPVPISPASFLDFEEYELVIEKALADEPEAYLSVLLGGEAGCGAGKCWRWNGPT